MPEQEMEIFTVNHEPDKRPPWADCKPFEDDKVFSPMASAFYRSNIGNRKGVPRKMVGDSLLRELGGLVYEKDGNVYVNEDPISQFYEKWIKDKIRETPDRADNVVNYVLGLNEENRERYGELAHRVMYGLFLAMDSPIETGCGTVEVHLLFSKGGEYISVESRRTARTNGS